MQQTSKPTWRRNKHGVGSQPDYKLTQLLSVRSMARQTQRYRQTSRHRNTDWKVDTQDEQTSGHTRRTDKWTHKTDRQVGTQDGQASGHTRRTVGHARRTPEGSLGRTTQDGHLDSHTAPELWPNCSAQHREDVPSHGPGPARPR